MRKTEKQDKIERQKEEKMEEEKVIQYSQYTIPYRIERGKVKHIYLKIKEDILVVKAPYYVTEKQIIQILLKKEHWIIKTMESIKHRKKEEEAITQEEIQELEKRVSPMIERYLQQTNLSPKQWKIKDIKYAWGSCSSKKNITLNAKLAKKSDTIIEYVVLHELCHLKYMNHSKEFWNLIEVYMPDYKTRRKELKNGEKS